MDASQEQLAQYSDTKKYQIKTSVENDRQEYCDDPVYTLRKLKLKLAITIGMVLGWTPRLDMRKTAEYKRHILHWHKQQL
jgi:hypothetical protein